VQTAAVSAQVVQALVDAGARYIVLPTLPQLGSFAERANYDADGRSALGIARSEASIAFNEAFQQQLSGMQGNFIRVDVTRLFEEVLANPAAFGYPLDIDQTRACFDAAAAGGPGCDEPAGRGRSSGGNADDFVFNDGLHPTQSSARGAADLIASVIQAPGIFALVPESVLGEARAFQNTLDSHFVQTRWEAPAEGWQVFASVQGASVDIAEGGATPAADSDSTDLTLGVSRGIGGGWSVGAAIGSQSTDSDIDLQGSELSTEGLIGSLFASYRQGDWFADLALGFGATDVDDIDRVFGIGPVQVRREHGETDADVTTLGADVGVDMTAAGTPLRFGPFLGLEYVEVEVDGYAEDGSSSSAMRFDDYERESLQGRAGVFASYPVKLGGATLDLHADVAYVEEFEGDTDDVVAVGNTLASGPWFRMPGYTIDDNGLRVAVGADASWASGVRVGLGYRYDDNDAEAGYLNLNASYAF
jgi:outer membrane lipase/esterase